MPKASWAGIVGLKKRHQKGCKFTRDPVRCACPWYAKYHGIEVNLAKWTRRRVVTKREADDALRQFKSAVDDGTYTPRRKEAPTEDDETPQGPKVPPRTLGQLISRYVAHADDQGGWAEGSGYAVMVDRIKREIGHLTLDTLNADALTDWLRVQSRTRRWSEKTWNDYRSCLYSFCLFAVDRDWLSRNPVPQIPRKTPPKPHEPERLEEDVEQRLLDACELLDKPEQRVTRSKVTQDQANEIRLRVAAGETQASLARELGVSPATVCQILKGQIWSPWTRTRSTKGREMKRRVLAAIRTGARKTEMLKITVSMIDFRDPECFVINLPPAVTKGGKTTGETERLYVSCSTLRAELLARRESVKGNRANRQYVFGRENGRRVKSFGWRKVYELAGLPYGRGKGYVWHTLRHESVSRFAEHTDNVVEVQKLARHRDLRTTQRYMHAREARLREVAKRAQRGA